MRHALLNHLIAFERKELSSPEGFQYNVGLGFWINREDNSSALVTEAHHLNLIRGSKKEDVETGEDLKGK